MLNLALVFLYFHRMIGRDICCFFAMLNFECWKVLVLRRRWRGVVFISFLRISPAPSYKMELATWMRTPRCLAWWCDGQASILIWCRINRWSEKCFVNCTKKKWIKSFKLILHSSKCLQLKRTRIRYYSNCMVVGMLMGMMIVRSETTPAPIRRICKYFSTFK